MLSKETKKLVKAFCALKAQGDNSGGTLNIWIEVMSSAFDNGDRNNGVEIWKLMQKFGLPESDIDKYEEQFTGAMLALGHRAKKQGF